MKDCAESMTRYAKAYSADYYSKLAEIYNRCKSADRQILKKNIFDMLDRMKSLLNNETMAGNLAKCAAAKATLEAVKPQIGSLATEITDALKQSAALKDEAVAIRAQIPAEYDVQRYKNCRQDYINKQSEIISCIGGIKVKLETIAESELQYNEYAAALKVASRALTDYETLTRAFGIDGIQRMIIKGVVPEIMTRANDILAAMTGGRMAVDFRTEREQKSSSKIINSLDIWINSLSGGSRPYNSHSGGEKVKIALAVTLGLSSRNSRLKNYSGN